jgi:hypothetical protein
MDTRPSPTPNASHPGAQPGGADSLERAQLEAKRQTEGIREQARSASQQAGQQASDVVQDAKTSINEAAQQARRKVGAYAEAAKVRGQEMLDQQKHRAADQLHIVGEAAHRAADKFREEKDDNIAGYIDAVADEVDRLGDYLERRDLRTLLSDTQRFARREPEWFLGGMFLAGLALTRFLKASSPAPRSYESQLGARGDYEPPPLTRPPYDVAYNPPPAPRQGSPRNPPVSPTASADRTAPIDTPSTLAPPEAQDHGSEIYRT